MASQVKCWC